MLKEISPIEPIEPIAAGNSQEELNDALLKAVRSRKPDELKRLLAAGADANSSDKYYSALGWLVRSGDSSSQVLITSILMNAGADPNLRKTDLEKRSPFNCACLLKRHGCISAMLDSDGSVKVDLDLFNLNSKFNLSENNPDVHFKQSMFIARESPANVLEKLQIYFEKNVLYNQKINDESSKFERGHLWLSFNEKKQNAFMHGSPENQRWIISKNFTDTKDLTESIDHDGRTALWLAVEKDTPNPKSVDFLLSLGANTDVKNLAGETLMAMAEKKSVNYPAVARMEIFEKLKAVAASRRAMAAIEEMMSTMSKSQVASP